MAKLESPVLQAASPVLHGGEGQFRLITTTCGSEWMRGGGDGAAAAPLVSPLVEVCS